MEMQVRNIIVKSNKVYFLWFFIFSVLFLFSYFFISYRDFSDDYYFLSSADKYGGLIDFILFRYDNWSGRVILEAILILALKSKILWSLLISTSILTLLFIFYDICLKDIKLTREHSFFVSMVFFLLSLSVTRESVWYITGAINYIFPLSCALLSIYIISRKNDDSFFSKVVVCFLLVIGSQSEQVCITVFAFFSGYFIYLLFLTKSIRFIFEREGRGVLLYFIVFILGALFLVGAPGNYVRLTAEHRYIPEFSSYSILDKVFNGLDVYNSHFTYVGNYLTKLLLLSLFVRFKSKRLSSLIIILKSVVFVGALQSQLFFWMHSHSDAGSISYVDSGGYNFIISLIITFGSIISFLWLLAISFQEHFGNIDINDEYFVSFVTVNVLMFLSFITIVLVGLSPTVYQSGPRIFLVGDVLFIMALIFSISIFRGHIRHAQ